MCKAEAEKLNRLSKVPRDLSFHDDKPRRAAVAAMKNLKRSAVDKENVPVKKLRIDKSDARARAEGLEILSQFSNGSEKESDDDGMDFEDASMASTEAVTSGDELLSTVSEVTRRKKKSNMGLLHKLVESFDEETLSQVFSSKSVRQKGES